MARYIAKRRGRYRSIFESQVAAQLPSSFKHESIKLPYVLHKTYTPDFIDADAKLIIEAKGVLHELAERQKLIAVKQQYPEWTFAICFQDPDQRISGTKMTHRSWAERHGFSVI